MAVKSFKPYSAGRRFMTVASFDEITTDKPEKSLIVTADYAENVDKSSRNIPGVKTINTIGLNVFDILNADKLFITKAAIARIEEVYA